MEAERAFIGLGSNLGDRLSTLESALRALADGDDVDVAAVSDVYETSPVGPVPQDPFLNAVAELCTRLSPRGLLDALLAVERAHGRERGQRWGPRTLDLDLLLFGGTRVVEPGLRVPHPHLTDRRFVLVPLLEIAGSDSVNPESGRLLGDHLRELDSTERVCRIGTLELPRP